ncbi:hypothetical protein CC1G_06026 [Coprinopsis cinerea okayama7|uniref:Uncharacterized protein n=1 Tax=Coprinopsis cinerea (strain Okayama-7 / 130 / ATCC MYA-4618 / FGSC 9003) TaxID=240176 RepID=A8N4P8_COPC7|nr:hypothetical protein CC1G_06026 [Coprinopsis cinerea okayama7\|eukprot:XP_001829817.2 hypothetical protein CC1G_06026 [Coprinopsis cinerea okayama7\
MSGYEIDEFYDKHEASAKLQDLIDECNKGEKTKDMQLSTSKIKTASVKRISRPESWRMYQVVNDEPTEIVFRIQGIIQSKELPPVGRNINRSNRAKKHLRQQVTIFGFGAPLFQNFADSVEAMYIKYGDFISDGHLEEWSPPTDGDSVGFDVINRYFTHANYATGEPQVPFHETVDPFDVLKQMGGGNYVHTQDNHVDYIERVIAENSKDYHRVKMRLILKALVLIDQQFREKACILRMRNRIKAKPTFTSLKRPAIYDIEEDINTSENAMSRMRLD